MLTKITLTDKAHVWINIHEITYASQKEEGAIVYIIYKDKNLFVTVSEWERIQTLLGEKTC